MKNMISVVICTYNGEKYIGAQIESILTQTLLPNEIVVGDDGSTDNTLRRIENLRSRIEEKGIRLTIYQNNHLGAHGNFKATFPKAIGEWIAPCDQDDIWLPEKLEKCAEMMKEGVDVVYCDEYILHENGDITENIIQKPNSVLDQLFGTHLAGHLLLLRRELLEVYGVAPEITFDYGLTIAASCRDSIAHVEEKLCYWRRHDYVVTTSMSNHNPYKVINKGKWCKWFDAMWTAFIGGGNLFQLQTDINQLVVSLKHIL
ncbi:MAG: glycosyltransferase [Lachnospira sp.]